MLQKIDEFGRGGSYLSALIVDLENLLNAMEDSDKNWRTDFYNYWADLEIGYALALDQGVDRLGPESEKIMSGALQALKSLIEAKSHAAD